MMNPPMPTLSPVWTSMRVDRFNARAAVGEGVAVTVGLGLGVGGMVGVAVAVAVGDGEGGVVAGGDLGLIDGPQVPLNWTVSIPM
jgi:hypothetical protein